TKAAIGCRVRTEQTLARPSLLGRRRLVRRDEPLVQGELLRHVVLRERQHDLPPALATSLLSAWPYRFCPVEGRGSTRPGQVGPPSRRRATHGDYRSWLLICARMHRGAVPVLLRYRSDDLRHAVVSLWPNSRGRHRGCPSRQARRRGTCPRFTSPASMC